MKWNPIHATLLALMTLVLLPWYTLHDDISCVVTNTNSHVEAENTDKRNRDVVVNGYYVAMGGIYVRRSGADVAILPDFFRLVALSLTATSTAPTSSSLPTVIISQDRHRWLIQQQQIITGAVLRRDMYFSTPEHAQQFLFQPPPAPWRRITQPVQGHPSTTNSVPSDLTVGQCRGSLAESPPLFSSQSQSSNLSTLLARPVTVALLLLLLLIAYWLWAVRVPVDSVSFSYEAVQPGAQGGRGEYWRGVSASLAHFEAMHLAFNCMSLYQLGELEELVYGSVAFCYLNVALVPVTMGLCVLLYYGLITYAGKTQLIQQQAVGYSCVLFAWMVAASVRMEQFCPLFFLPSLCFPTWHLPLPLLPAHNGLPVNLGPFLLLLVTKLVLPQSSLTGHLAGIMAGFPLAWGGMSWLTPPVLGAGIAVCFVHLEGLWVWTLPGYTRTRAAVTLARESGESGESSSEWDSLIGLSSDAVLTEFVPSRDLQAFRRLRLLLLPLGAWSCGALPLALLLPEVPISSSTLHSRLLAPDFWLQMLPPMAVLGMVGMAVEARRCEWLTSSRHTQQQCTDLLWVALCLVVLVLCCDVATLTALLTCRSFLLHNYSTDGAGPASLSDNSFAVGCVVVAGGVLLHFAAAMLLLHCLQGMTAAQTRLEKLQLDRAAMRTQCAQMGLRSAPASFHDGAGMVTGHRATRSRAMPVPAPATVAVSPSVSVVPRVTAPGPSGRHGYAPVPLDEQDQIGRGAAGVGGLQLSEAGAAAMARMSRGGSATGRGKGGGDRERRGGEGGR